MLLLPPYHWGLPFPWLPCTGKESALHAVYAHPLTGACAASASAVVHLHSVQCAAVCFPFCLGLHFPASTTVNLCCTVLLTPPLSLGSSATTKGSSATANVL